jgi:hypothetical protein
MNAVILTIFLWHITAAIVAAAVLHALGVLPTPAAGSAAWLAWRIPWLIIVGVTLAPLVAVFGPIEMRPKHTSIDPVPRSRLRLVLTATGFIAASYGLIDNSLLPPTSPALFGLPVTALVVYLGGAGLLRWLRRTSVNSNRRNACRAKPRRPPSPQPPQ